MPILDVKNTGTPMEETITEAKFFKSGCLMKIAPAHVPDMDIIGELEEVLANSSHLCNTTMAININAYQV